MTLTKEEKRRLAILKKFKREVEKLIKWVEKELGPKAIKEIENEHTKENG